MFTSWWDDLRTFVWLREMSTYAQVRLRPRNLYVKTYAQEDHAYVPLRANVHRERLRLLTRTWHVRTQMTPPINSDMQRRHNNDSAHSSLFRRRGESRLSDATGRGTPPELNFEMNYELNWTMNLIHTILFKKIKKSEHP